MANQGYLGRKTHPAMATDKAKAFFFFSPGRYVSFSVPVYCRLLSSFICPGRYKGATSLVASLRNQSRGLYKYTCVGASVCVCICLVTDVLYRLKICVTDNCGSQMASLNGNGQLTPGHQLIS